MLSEELDVVEPCMASRSNIGRVLLQNISETLTELDTGGGGLKPRLAESWEAVDDDTWRFKLRPGVKFTDGSDFDAEDVVYSLTRTTSDKITCEIGAKYFGGMKLDAKAVDATTLEITSDPPQPILPLLMSTLTIVPTGTDPNAFIREPIGTGPYIFSEWNAGQNIILTRNENQDLRNLRPCLDRPGLLQLLGEGTKTKEFRQSFRQALLWRLWGRSRAGRASLAQIRAEFRIRGTHSLWRGQQGSANPIGALRCDWFRRQAITGGQCRAGPGECWFPARRHPARGHH